MNVLDRLQERENKREAKLRRETWRRKKFIKG
jgi:hypothetical protein